MIVSPPTPTTAGPSTPRTPDSMRFAPTCASAYCTPSTAMAEGAIFPFPGPAPTLHQRELYLRALEQEREEILAEAYAAKRSGSPLSNYSDHYMHEEYDSEDGDEDDDERGHPRYDERGRQLRFRETVRQRQARLEFLRRQDFARRLAHRGLEDAKASAYAIKRLPPPRARPIERVNAATKIQRTWRLHRTVKALENLTQRVQESHETFLADSESDYEDAWKRHAETLHELLRELSERTGVLASAPQSQSHSAGASSVSAKSDTHALHPRVRIAARTAVETLRSELSLLDRAQISRHHAPTSASSSSQSQPFLSGSFSSDSDDEDGDDDFYDDDEDEDEDSDDDDSDYACYTYTPPQSQSLISTELYVVDEEDEDVDLERDSDYHVPSLNAMRLYNFPYNPVSPPASPTKSTSRHQRSRHAPLSLSTSLKTTSFPTPIPTSMPGLIRSPLARSPSLASIPEEDEEY